MSHDTLRSWNRFVILHGDAGLFRCFFDLLSVAMPWVESRHIFRYQAHTGEDVGAPYGTHKQGSAVNSKLDNLGSKTMGTQRALFTVFCFSRPAPRLVALTFKQQSHSAILWSVCPPHAE